MQPNERNIKSNKRVAYHATPTNNYEIKKLKQNSAITLIALVITIIVLLILAGIALTLVLGENGLMNKAKNAKTETLKSQAIEDIKLRIIEAQTTAGAEGRTATLVDLINEFKNATGEYIIGLPEEAKIKQDNIGIADTVTENTNYIYVTNLSFGYRVKVNKNLKVDEDITAVAGETSASGNSQQQAQTAIHPDSVDIGEILPENITMTVGDTKNLTQILTPRNTTNTNVTWNSSDTSVATIDESNTLTALEEGTSIITLTTEDGNKTDTCELTVENASQNQEQQEEPEYVTKSGTYDPTKQWYYKNFSDWDNSRKTNVTKNTILSTQYGTWSSGKWYYGSPDWNIVPEIDTGLTYIDNLKITGEFYYGYANNRMVTPFYHTFRLYNISSDYGTTLGDTYYINPTSTAKYGWHDLFTNILVKKNDKGTFTLKAYFTHNLDNNPDSTSNLNITYYVCYKSDITWEATGLE